MSESDKSLREYITEAFAYHFALDDESDRGAAVLAAARFEHQLEDLIARRCRIGDDDTLRMNALKSWIRSFAAKIDVAFALGLYDQDTYTRLRTVLKIRNKFAHSQEILSFDHRSIADLCGNLDTKTKLGGPNVLRQRYLRYLFEVEGEIMHTLAFTSLR